MNWIPGFNFCALALCAVLGSGCGTQVSDPLAPVDPSTYRVDYQVVPDSADATVRVTMRVAQSRFLLRELSFKPGPHMRNIRADGELSIDSTRATWQPSETGGAMSWEVAVAHRRNGDGYDAWLGPDFGLFRAEDIIPRAASRTAKGAGSETWLSFRLPATWSAVTEYYDDNGRIRIDNPERRFDQPSGWIVIGDLGVRRERIAGVRVAVAGPVGHSIRRLETIALLNWTLPELARILPELPPRLTIVSAGYPMWRGGLSAPQSMFVHAERPLISENATSTLLHEIMHMSLGFKAADDHDWIVEGMAEYYSLQLLRRSGTITPERYADAVADLAVWAEEADHLCAAVSTGATTALAVGIFDALDVEIAERTEGGASIDDLASALSQFDKAVDVGVLTEITENLTGAKPDALHSDNLLGCRTIAREST